MKPLTTPVLFHSKLSWGCLSACKQFHSPKLMEANWWKSFSQPTYHRSDRPTEITHKPPHVTYRPPVKYHRNNHVVNEFNGMEDFGTSHQNATNSRDLWSTSGILSAVSFRQQCLHFRYTTISIIRTSGWKNQDLFRLNCLTGSTQVPA